LLRKSRATRKKEANIHSKKRATHLYDKMTQPSRYNIWQEQGSRAHLSCNWQAWEQTEEGEGKRHKNGCRLGVGGSRYSYHTPVTKEKCGGEHEEHEPEEFGSLPLELNHGVRYGAEDNGVEGNVRQLDGKLRAPNAIYYHQSLL
jgi:hypothetical protein